ncbi:gametogenetin-binding protein 1-like isoform 2-T2 [Molossus nigricans]
MESPAPTPPSQILGHSTMVRFFRSLVGSKGSPGSSDKALLGGRQCLSREPEAVSLMTDRQGAVRKEPRRPAKVHHTSGTPPQHDPPGLGMEDVGAHTATTMEVLSIMAPGVELKWVRPRGSQEVLGDLSEEEEEAAGEASRDTRTSDRGHFAHALERRATGPLEVSPEAFTVEEEECLLGGDLRLASVKVGATPWNHLLTLYKQLQKLTMAKAWGRSHLLSDLAQPQFPLKDGLSHLEEEGEEEDSSFKLCVPGIVTLQSPLHKTFRSTDTVGVVESDLKKLLEVQQESRLWKVGSREGQEPLVQPEVALEAASIVGEQEHQAKGEGGRPPAFGECWGPGRRAPRQRKHHPRLEGRVQSPVGVVSSTERLLLEEMDERGNWLLG